MPEIDPAIQARALEELLKLDKDWVPHSVGSSLYIRPTMIATEPHLGVRPADNYLYFIITGPVAAYYAEGFNPVKIYVSEEYVRTVRVGSAKPRQWQTMPQASTRRKSPRRRVLPRSCGSMPSSGVISRKWERATFSSESARSL